MGSYIYSQSKVIDEVTFKRTANGAVRAYLHARDGVDAAALQAVQASLMKAHYEWIPFTLDGKPMLEVRGFSREMQLLTLLKENRAVEGKAKVYQDKQDNIGWGEWFQKRSLQAAGWLYAIGDAGFIGYGWKDSSPLDFAAGIFYALPTPALWFYGRNDQSEFEVKELAKQMAAHFRKEIPNLPPECSLESITADRKKGLIEKTSDLLQRYPSEFMNLCYTAAGLCIMAAAGKHLNMLTKSGAPAEAVEGWLKQLQKTQPGATRQMASQAAIKNSRLENWLNVGVGVSTVSSGLFGTIVKEKAPDPDDPPKTGLAGVWEWVRQRPLAITGVGLMISTLLHAASTTVALKGNDTKHKKAVPLRATFVIGSLLAELMVAISSKGHGEGVVSDKSVDQSAVALAADLIIKQPKALQNSLIEYMGKFLGQPDVLAMGDKEAINTLRQQVEAMRNNPWAQAPDTNCEPPAIKPAPEPETATWQGKMAAKNASETLSQLSA